MTNKELLELIKNKDIELFIDNECDIDNDDIEEFIENYEESFVNFSKVADEEIKYKSTDLFVVLPNYSGVLIIKENKPYKVVLQYELMNPFILDHYIILPGHDDIRCYDLNTGIVTIHPIR